MIGRKAGIIKCPRVQLLLNSLSTHHALIFLKMAREAKCIKPVKRKSTVVSSQTYRKMVEEVLEEATANALDLHGIYEALAVKYDQYRDDSVEVDWRVNEQKV